MEARGYAYVTGKDGRPVLLGKGAFGRVCLVTRDGATFIVKDVRLDERSERQRKRVRHEIGVLATLEHPNIIQLEEYWEHLNLVTMVMEYASDVTLRNSILRQRDLAAVAGHGFLEVHVLTWSVQLLLALDYMHGLGHLHRDLKSDNVFVTPDNVIKLGDFGVTSVVGLAKDAASLTPRAPPYYLAPELFQNAPYSVKSDVWALGCVVYELAALRRPFEADDIQVLIRSILDAEAPELGPQYTNDLRLLLALLLQKAPDDRPTASDALHMWIFRRHLQGFRRRLQEQAAMATRQTLTAEGFERETSGNPPKAGRRTSRLVPPTGDVDAPGRLTSAEPSEDDPDTHLPSRVANVVNFGTDRQKMKAFLKGPAPEDIHFGVDAPKMKEFLEGPMQAPLPRSLPVQSPSGLGRPRSDILLPSQPGAGPGPEPRYVREVTAREHWSILGHIIKVFCTPKRASYVSRDLSCSGATAPPEELARDLSAAPKDAPTPPTCTTPVPDAAPRRVSVDDELEAADLREDTGPGTEATAADSDVRCASPESRLDEVEDLSAMGGDEDGGGATAEGAEVVEEDIEGDGGVYTPLHCGAGRPAF